jgi:branched-subunit amino acid ABC-type transport system permease component
MILVASVSTFIQYCVNGFINGSAYGLIGLSFGLVVAVTGRFHFAWATAYAIAGFLTAYIVNTTSIPIVPAIVIGLFAACVFNILSEVLVYRPVAARAGSNALLAIFVASFGLTIAIPNLITWIVGTQAAAGENLNWISSAVHTIGKVTFTTLELVSVIVAWACVVATWALLKYTPLGRRIRAVQVNPGMAEAVGIDSGTTFVVVFVISALLGGVAALFASMRYTATANMGLTPVFYAFVVAFAAGLGRSPLRIMVVGAGIGIIEGASAQWLNVEWQQVVVFGVLLIYLIFKAARTWRPDLFRVTLPSRTRVTTANPESG